ncbi:MAG: peptide chain release factor-like protein [Planctomycetota bacterium]
MTETPDWLSLDDDALLAQCDVHIYKASGPGGQHRNKVSSAVRLHHRPTGLSAHGGDSRSQHTNKRLALRRLRRQIALTVRRPADPTAWARHLPEPLAAAIVRPANRKAAGARLQVGPKDERFWPVAQALLDLLDACDGRLADTAAALGVTTSNLVAHLKKDRHLFAVASQIRKAHGHGPLK